MVAGCNLTFAPETYTWLSNMNFLSPEGRCHPFDHRGNGYGRPGRKIRAGDVRACRSTAFLFSQKVLFVGGSVHSVTGCVWYLVTTCHPAGDFPAWANPGDSSDTPGRSCATAPRFADGGILIHIERHPLLSLTMCSPQNPPIPQGGHLYIANLPCRAYYCQP